MPFYDYQCQSCQHQFTESLKIADRKQPCDAPCPDCGESNQIVLLVGAPMICDPVRIGIKKPTPEFREVMRGMKKSVGRHSSKAIRDY